MEKQVKSKRVTFRLDGDRLRLLEDLASREGYSVSLIVRSLVYRYIEDFKRLGLDKRLKR